VTIAYLAKPLTEPDPEPGERSLDDDDADDVAPERRHLTLVGSADCSAAAASRRESMARHPSAARRP